MKPHRDGFARFSARSVRRGDDRVEDATRRRHSEACATLPVVAGGPADCGGRRNGLTMPPSPAPPLLPDGQPTRSLWVFYQRALV